MNLIFSIVDWFMGTTDLVCGLFGHLSNGHIEKQEKRN